MAIQPSHLPPLHLLALLEATTLNAVAKNVLNFCRCVGATNLATPSSAPIEISIVTFDRAPAANLCSVRPNEFVKAARKLGIPIDVVPERFRFDLRVMKTLNNLVAQNAPHLIVSHNVKSHFLTRICRLHRDRPWVAFHHGYTSTDLKMRAYNQLDRWSLAGADRVVTVCGHFARQLQGRGVPPDRIIVRHNAIGPPAALCKRNVREVRESLGVEGGNRLILAVGRLSREKGHVDLVSAFAKLSVMRPGMRAKLVIVGEGPERAAIEAAIQTHGLEDDVRLAGHIRDVRPYYAAADIFVLPSYSEGSPYVLLEAMTAGVPIVATEVGGVPEILTHGETGFLAPPHDARSLATAISCIIDDTELAKRIAANASALVSRRYSLENYVLSLSDIYRSLVLGTIPSQLQMV